MWASHAATRFEDRAALGAGPLAATAAQSLQSRAPDDGRPLVSLGRKEISHLALHEGDELLALHHVGLVEEDDDAGHAHLPREFQVFAGLGHDAVRRGHHQNRPVHLGGPGDHVLDEIGMSGTIHVGVGPGLRLVAHAGGVDADAAGALLGRLVDLVVRRELGEARRRQHFASAPPSGWSCRGPRGPGSRCSRAAWAGVSYRSTSLRLASFRYLLTGPLLSFSARGPSHGLALDRQPTTDDRQPLEVEPATRIELVTSSLPRMRSTD